MRKNKKLWSYALAGALAVSNLSGVVAAPFSTIVAQAAEGALTVSTVATGIKVGSPVTFAVTVTQGGAAEADATLAVFLEDGTTSAADKVSIDGYKITFKEAGKYKVKATKDDNSGMSDAITVANGYTATLDGADIATDGSTEVNPNKSYTLNILQNGNDITEKYGLTVSSENATISGRTLTIAENAIENDMVVIEYTPTGDEKQSIKMTVAKGTASTSEVATLTLKPTTVEITGVETKDVLIGDDVELPSGYKWKTSNPEYDAKVISGESIVSKKSVNKNTITLESKSVSKKSEATVRYTFVGVAENAGGDSITYEGQIDQTVTVLPEPTYKLTIDGKDYSATSDPYTLMEEDGSITITAAVKPAGKDIPETDDVKFAWEATSSWLQVSPEAGATVTVSPKGTFKKADDGKIKLTVTNKQGNGEVPGIPSGSNEFIFTVKTDTTAKPTITASAQEVTPEDEVTFTVTGADGKALTNFEIHDNKQDITKATGKYNFTVGSHKVTVVDIARQTESDAITITSRSEDGVVATGLKIESDDVELNGIGTAQAPVTDTINVTVLPDGTGTDQKKAEINTVTVKSNNTEVASAKVTAGPTDANVSTVTITAVAPGETTIEITADDKNVKDKKVINVTVAGYKGIVLTPESGDVEIGKTLKITADVQVYGKGASKDIVWHSTDESVATVKDGTVTGVAEGTAKIYATAKNDDSKKSNEVEITVTDNTVSDAIAAAEAAADKAVKEPTDANIQAAKDAVAAAKKAGASESALKSANEKIAQAEAANADAKKKAEENAKAADGSAKETPAAAGTELVDANGNKTGYKVTDANASAPEVEYVGPSDKNATKADIPETQTDLSGNTYKVTSVAANAFEGSKVKTVTIRKNIKKIDPNAFKKSKVKNVKIKSVKLTKKMTKAFKKLKKGGKITVSGKHKAKNKELLNKLSNVKNGKTKVK